MRENHQNVQKHTYPLGTLLNAETRDKELSLFVPCKSIPVLPFRTSPTNRAIL